MISAIVVNYNGAEFLSACLSGLTTWTWRDLKMITVGNVQADESDRICDEDAGDFFRFVGTCGGRKEASHVGA
jgi:GT2 family glycosyltransferase